MLPEDVERLALLGWQLHPASTSSRASCFQGAADQSTHDLDTLAAWSRQYRGCNWRVRCAGSGIFALDLDIPGADHADDGVAAMRALIDKHGSVPPCPIVLTGGGGQCWVFADPNVPIVGRTGWPAPGIDPRRGPLTFTVPPSRHHRTSQHYRWWIPPWEVTPPPAPAWLLRLLAPPPVPEYAPRSSNTIQGAPQAERLLDKAMFVVANAYPGTRNESLNRWAFIIGLRVRAGELQETHAQQSLARASHAAGIPAREAQATIASGFRSAKRRA